MKQKNILLLLVTFSIFLTITIQKIYFHKFLPEEKELNENHLYLTPMCRGMFNLDDESWANSPILKNNIKAVIATLAKVKNLKQQITDHYDPLAQMLPPMVEELSTGELYFSNITRLHKLNGQLPYLPCKIQHYESNDIKKCFQERQKVNKTFWIVYYGDSTVRYPFLFFVNETQKQFNWKVTEPKNEIFFTVHDKKPMDDHIIEAKSSSGARITYIKSVYGIHENNNSLSGFLENICNEQNVAPIPDTIVLGIGFWALWSGSVRNSHFKGFDMLLSNYKSIHKKLHNLSRKTLILTLSLTRKRLSLRRITGTMVQYGKFAAFEDSNVELIDQLKLMSIEETGLVYWDSSVAFNLANHKECSLLVAKNHPSIFEDLVNRDLPFNAMCHDDIHKTKSTIRDEINMIVNYLCNDFQTPKQEHLCC